MIKLDWIKKLFSLRPGIDTAETERLRLDFKERYAAFKQLISANNKALEMMAGMERKLIGDSPFSMSFIRSSATTISANVLKMINALQQLAPGKFSGLTQRYDSIENSIQKVLTEKRPDRNAPVVLSLDRINKDHLDLAGSKMANLGELKNRIGLNVPPGFVITAAAYEMFFDHNQLHVEIARQFQLADMQNLAKLYRLQSHLHQLIVESELPRQLEDAIAGAWKKMEKEVGSGATIAMRSSAFGEDEQNSSFAGQYRSELNVSSDHVFDSYKQVVAGKYNLQAMTYRLDKGIKDEDIAMCVGCMAMIDAVSGGVIYSSNPIDRHDNSVFINAAWGLPKAVVDGSTDCDLFVVSRKQPLKIVFQEIKPKHRKFVCYPIEGVCRIDLVEDAARNQPSIDKKQAVELARLAIQIETHYRSPQDIEWAIDQKGEIYILQCRPLQRTATLKPGLSETTNAKTKDPALLQGGITASPGAASGKVYPVRSGLDLLEFPQGAILLAEEAHPRWAALLGRASGVITERGSFAGHLASVAREFGLPALFGVTGATDRLERGRQITLDATNRSVFPGRVESLLTASKREKHLMTGSPVHKTLALISRYIIPLNLLEPDGPGFRPENCRTLHDITRFVHEKSVHEMFCFGGNRKFAKRSSKQLYHHAPLKWWVLNLDDGFAETVRGKYIKLAQINSVPMLAFWEGFTAIPWEGPPSVDGRGFASVMFQSTANPALVSGVRSKYANRNYIMISKHYFNLNFQIGYHFSNLEALVGDQKAENFIGFQFKGGAADITRRCIRVLFIKTILEGYGFRVETKKDNLIARMDGRVKTEMLERVKLLGYLILHTGQIDMIMANCSKTDQYRTKFIQDIHNITGLPTMQKQSESVNLEFLPVEPIEEESKK